MILDKCGWFIFVMISCCCFNVICCLEKMIKVVEIIMIFKLLIWNNIFSSIMLLLLNIELILKVDSLVMFIVLIVMNSMFIKEIWLFGLWKIGR